jgi:hypothetical protein
MADEAPETIGGGFRGFLGALAFVSLLIGAEVLREQGPFWIGLSLIIAALPIYISPGIWNLIRKKNAAPKANKLEYLHHKDTDLGSAIITMALRSAWGRWYAAQHLINSRNAIDDIELLRTAGTVVMDNISDGDLEVRGRQPGRMEYETIARTDWQSSALEFVNNPISLWKMIIIPKGGVEITPSGTIERPRNAAAAARNSQLAGYASLLIDAYQFETLFPKKRCHRRQGKVPPLT